MTDSKPYQPKPPYGKATLRGKTIDDQAIIREVEGLFQFTADSGDVLGSAIDAAETLADTYNRYRLREAPDTAGVPVTIQEVTDAKQELDDALLLLGDAPIAGSDEILKLVDDRLAEQLGKQSSKRIRGGRGA